PDGLRAVQFDKKPSRQEPAEVAPQPAARMVIVPVEMSAPLTGVPAVFGDKKNIGTGFEALMKKELTRSGIVTVVEPPAELSLRNSSRAVQGSDLRVGPVKGVDFFLRPNVTAFGKEYEERRGGGGLGSTKDDKAVVKIEFDLLDAATGEKIESKRQIRGES